MIQSPRFAAQTPASHTHHQTITHSTRLRCVNVPMNLCNSDHLFSGSASPEAVKILFLDRSVPYSQLPHPPKLHSRVIAHICLFPSCEDVSFPCPFFLLCRLLFPLSKTFRSPAMLSSLFQFRRCLRSRTVPAVGFMNSTLLVVAESSLASAVFYMNSPSLREIIPSGCRGPRAVKTDRGLLSIRAAACLLASSYLYTKRTVSLATPIRYLFSLCQSSHQAKVYFRKVSSELTAFFKFSDYLEWSDVTTLVQDRHIKIVQLICALQS